MKAEQLDVVIPYNNPCAWGARHNNMRRTEDEVLKAGARLTTVEVKAPGQSWDLPDRDGVRRIRLHSRDMLWHKENQGNIGFWSIPDWEYGLLLDGDILFYDPGIFARVVHALQFYRVVQVSSELVNLGPRGEHLGKLNSYMHLYHSKRNRIRALDCSLYDINIPIKLDKHGYPGGAWAFRRDVFEQIGGLLDICIVGAGDQHMAWAMTETPDSLCEGTHPAVKKPMSGYAISVLTYRKKVAVNVARDVGLVPGLAFHLWHGKRVDRQYPDRWRILENNDFDPELDLRRDKSGLIHLRGNKPGLRDDLRTYFKSRNEDSVDLDPL
jgi:hypothetical protein